MAYIDPDFKNELKHSIYHEKQCFPPLLLMDTGFIYICLIWDGAD